MPFGPKPPALPASSGSALRLATADDLPRLLEIRDAAGSDTLSDPAAVTGAGLSRLIADATVVVAREEGRIVGFSAVDRVTGEISGLLVDTEQRGKGTGRLLLAMALTTLGQAGHREARLTLAERSGATRHYLASGWSETGRNPTGGVVLKKPL